MVDIVTRAQWGANYTSAYYRVGMAEKDEFFVHYHGGEPSASVGVWVPRNVEAIHHGNGWSGVGYSFVVDQAGTIFEGRGWDGVCVACPDHNRRGIHVYVAVGGNQEATDAAKASVVALRDEHRRLRALGKHSRPQDELVHGDKYPTACAGPTLNPWVHAGYPLTTAAPVPEEDIMASLDDLARLLTDKLTVKLNDNQMSSLGTGRETWAFTDLFALVAGRVGAIRGEVLAAASDARIARALAEKSAAEGRALSPEEIDAVAKGVADELSGGLEVQGDVRLAPKQQPAPEVSA